MSENVESGELYPLAGPSPGKALTESGKVAGSMAARISAIRTW
jgi:hypothetical protein